MLLNNLKLAANDAIILLKKHILAIVLSSLFIFGVLWLGNVISVITSRQILDHLSVKVEGLDAANLSSIRVLATLSRAGNTMNLTRVLEENQDEWNNPSQTFIKRILVGVNSESLGQLSKINITLGEKNFVFTKKQFLAEWKKLDANSADWYMSDINGSPGYFVYEAPENVKVKPWQVNVPLASSLLSSINFKGREYLIQKPLVSSVKNFSLLAAVLLIIFFVTSFFKRKNNDVFSDEDTDLRQREFIIFVLSVAATAVFLFLLCVAIKFFYKPDTSRILLEASKVYLDKLLPAFIPKLVERAQFTSSVLLSPFLLLIFYKLFSRYVYKIKKEIIPRLYFFTGLAAPLAIFSIAYIGLAVSNFMYVEKSYFFKGLGKYLYSLALFPIGTYFAMSLKKPAYDNLIKNLVYIFSGVLIAVVFFINIISANGSELAGINIVGHANPVFNSIAQVAAGKTMLVNLSGQYGLYPVFLNPVFKLVGLSVLSITSVMGALLSLNFLFIFLFLRRLIKNKIILLIGFSTVMLYFLDSPANPYPYFQYYPIRTIFPSLLLLLSSFYFESRNKILYLALFIISALAVLWNFDSGIMVFASWILALVYLEVFRSDKKLMIRNIAGHALMGAAALGVVFASYAGYAFLISGQTPDFSIFFRYQRLFYEGFMLIAMPFPHVWILVVITFLSGLLLSIKKWLVKDGDWKNASIFILTILGVGLFSYYEGRSHDATFYGPLYLSLMLLVIFADIIFYNAASNPKLYGQALLFLLVLFFILSSPISVISHSHKYYNWVSAGFSAFSSDTATAITKNIDFIKNNTVAGESVVILAGHYDGAFYGESHTRSVLDVPSFTEIIFKSEADDAVDFLKCNKNYKVFVYPFSKFYMQFGNDLVDSRINRTVEKYYTVISTSTDDMALLLNRAKNLNDCR